MELPGGDDRDVFPGFEEEEEEEEEYPLESTLPSLECGREKFPPDLA